MICTAFMLGGAEMPVLLQLLGRLHPAVVHFPIALLVVAAGLEGWQLIRRRPQLAAATPVCLALGAAGAGVASVLGWLLDEGEGGDLVDVHRWAGVASTIAALLAVGLVRASHRASARGVLRPVLFVGATLVGVTGYLGGELVFGHNHLFRGMGAASRADAPRLAASTRDNVATPPPTSAGPVAAADRVDFRAEVAPILRGHCLRCHGGEKVSAKLSLKTRERARKGGKSGSCIVPGQSGQSALYQLLVTTDADSQMPPPREKPLTRAQVETIRRWIDEGAEWPEGETIQ